MAGNQAYLFMVFTLVGIAIGVLFDIFRILRKTIKTKDFVTYIEDILFWILTGLIIIFSMYKFCDGELRFFMIIGTVLGLIMYLITVSKYIIKTSVYVINKIKKIIVYPIKIVIKVIKKLFFQPIVLIFVNFKNKNVKNNKKWRDFL